MESGIEITKGTILVATHTMSTGCGIKYIREGSIIKVAEYKPAYRDLVDTYRNQSEERDYNTHNIYLDYVRFATDNEIEMWNNEVYNINVNKEIAS